MEVCPSLRCRFDARVLYVNTEHLGVPLTWSESKSGAAKGWKPFSDMA